MKIGIDAGHGYNTAGKRTPDNSMREWEFNKRVAELLITKLNSSGIETVRVDDQSGNTDVSLKERVARLNANNVNFVISIHANAFGDGSWNGVQGIETFVIAKGGKAEQFANVIQKNLINNISTTNRGVKVANFYIIRYTRAPAILVELGFMTNQIEAESLKSEDYRNKCADILFNSILEYTNIDGGTPIEPEKPAEPNPGPGEENNNGGYEDMKEYRNGSTKEIVYQDSRFTKEIGFLSPYEKNVYGVKIQNGVYLVMYNLDGTSAKKAGFVKYAGGL